MAAIDFIYLIIIWIEKNINDLNQLKCEMIELAYSAFLGLFMDALKNGRANIVTCHNSSLASTEHQKKITHQQFRT